MPDCLPTAVGTVKKCCRWVCGCVQMSVRACGGLCVGGAAAPGKWRGAGSGLCLWGFRWSLRTCGWLSICLPLLVAFCFLSLRLTTLAELQDKLPPQAPPLLSPQLPLLPPPGGWGSRGLALSSPKRVILGLRCLQFGTGRVTMATWGHSICPFPTLGTEVTGMIHVFKESHELTGFNP